MTHLDEPTLLLYAYGETSESGVQEIEEHLAACADCRGRLTGIERGGVLADLAVHRRAPGRRWFIPAAAVLAAAATVAAIMLFPIRERDTRPTYVLSTTAWSFPAGYVAGGPDLAAADSILHRLEQEISHVDH